MATGRRRNRLIIISKSQGGSPDGHWVTLLVVALALVALGWVAPARGQDQLSKGTEPTAAAGQGPIADNNDPRVKAAVARAASFLRTKGTLPQVGELSLSINALERFATLADQRTIADVDWYSKGAELILARQQAQGSWSAGNGDTVDSSFAVLFLVRSTKMIIDQRPLKLLGPGTLESIDFSKLASRGRIRDLFAVDSDRVERAGEESTRIKPSQRDWNALGPKAAGPWKELEKGYAAKDSIRIIVALNDLARTHDVRVVPLLIDAMYYEDSERVMLAARESLCFLSRRIEGPYTGATAEEWEAEIAKWKKWYRSVRPQADDEDDVVRK